MSQESALPYDVCIIGAGLTSPYEFAITLAENAIANSVELRLQETVLAITPTDGAFQIKTSQSDVTAWFVINCAGAYSDRIAAMVRTNDYKITPRRARFVQTLIACEKIVSSPYESMNQSQ